MLKSRIKRKIKAARPVKEASREEKRSRVEAVFFTLLF